MSMLAIATATMYPMVLIGAATDLRWGKVPNALTAPCVLLGIVLSVAGEGIVGLGSSLAGIAIALILWFLAPLAGNVLGGGDVKLLAAVGALCGPVFVLYAIAFSAFWGGLLAVSLAAGRHKLLASCRQLGQWLYCRSVLQMDAPLETAAVGLRVPFAVAIALGSITASCVVL
jgi:prepilin peptidase CpaA